jgi:hypothetical protein
VHVNHRRDSPPTATATTTAVDTRLPPAWHEQTERELDAAHAAGYRQALADIAAGHVEIGDAWRPIGRASQAQRVAARIAEFEECARRVAAEMGRPPGYTYRGGPAAVWGNDTCQEAA